MEYYYRSGGGLEVVVEVTFMKSVVAVAPAPSTQARCRTTSYYSCGAFFSNKGWPLHSIWIVTYTTTRGAAFTTATTNTCVYPEIIGTTQWRRGFYCKQTFL